MKHVALIVALVACSKPADPPPAAHHEDRHEPAIATPPLSLAVTIDGSAATWPQAIFDKTLHFESTNNDGEARDTWSLRELVHGAAGATAHVTTVIGETRQSIDAAAWADPTKTPIVHRTRRGGLKFRWADASGKWGETGRERRDRPRDQLEVASVDIVVMRRDVALAAAPRLGIAARPTTRARGRYEGSRRPGGACAAVAAVAARVASGPSRRKQS